MSSFQTVLHLDLNNVLIDADGSWLVEWSARWQVHAAALDLHLVALKPVQYSSNGCDIPSVMMSPLCQHSASSATLFRFRYYLRATSTVVVKICSRRRQPMTRDVTGGGDTSKRWIIASDPPLIALYHFVTSSVRVSLCRNGLACDLGSAIGQTKVNLNELHCLWHVWQIRGRYLLPGSRLWEETSCKWKPNSITLAGSELVRSWFELDSVFFFSWVVV